jgi:hypothetical protein
MPILLPPEGCVKRVTNTRRPGWAALASRHHDAVMAKIRTTVTLDEQVLRAVRIKAARTGRRDSEVIEEALRRNLGPDLLERLWASADLEEDEAMRLAVAAQHESRRA